MELGATLAADLAYNCREGKLEDLLGELARHKLDIVITDTPLPPSPKCVVFSHPFGECGLSFATVPCAMHIHRVFQNAMARQCYCRVKIRLCVLVSCSGLSKGVRPRIAGEFDDSALMSAFGQAGVGFLATSAIADMITRQ